MRYKVEYLADAGASVCDVRYLYVEDIAAAVDKARAAAAFERRWAGANAYQIRDLYDDEQIVAAEKFEAATQNT